MDIDEKIRKLPEFGKDVRILEVRKQWRRIGRRRAAIEDIETPIFILRVLDWFQ